jgi:hypothetical protein
LIQKASDVKTERSSKHNDDFVKRRKAHYNEFQALRKFRELLQRQSCPDPDELEVDPLVADSLTELTSPSSREQSTHPAEDETMAEEKSAADRQSDSGSPRS